MRILDRATVQQLLSLPECITAVEDAFRDYALDRMPAPPGVLGTHVTDGGFHIKAATLARGPGYYAAKINANFPGNPARSGLPTVQGMIALFELRAGRLLALLDSIEITIQRTAAATAVAAKHLALPKAATLTIVGAGIQGRSHLLALRAVRPLRRVHVLDQDRARAETFAREMATPDLEVRVAGDLTAAIESSDILVTCTPSHRPFITPAMLHPGLFIAAVGADSPEKQELAPEVLARSRVVTDLTRQAETMGDLHHALAGGVVERGQVHGELGQLVAGQLPGRTDPAQVFVFDSTGTALQDVVAAALVYERAEATGRGVTLDL